MWGWGIWKSCELISGNNSLPRLYSLPHSCGWVMVVMAWMERERLLPASSRCGPGDSFQLPDNLEQVCDLLTPQASHYQLRLTCTLSDAIILLPRGYWQGDFKGQVYGSFSFTCCDSQGRTNAQVIKGIVHSCLSKSVCCKFKNLYATFYSDQGCHVPKRTSNTHTKKIIKLHS